MKAGKEKRPRSVTAIAIFITIYGVYLTVPAYYEIVSYSYKPGHRTFNVDEMFSVWMALVGSVNLVSGIAIFGARNWGRRLYFYFMPAAILLDWLVFRSRGLSIQELIMAAAVYAAFFVIQKIPSVSSFFE
jgi:hypothetical protein